MKNARPYSKASEHCADEEIPLSVARVDSEAKFKFVYKLMADDSVSNLWIALEKKAQVTTVSPGACFMNKTQVLQRLRWSVGNPDVTAMDWLSHHWHFDVCSEMCICLTLTEAKDGIIFADGDCLTKHQVLCQGERKVFNWKLSWKKPWKF